MRLDDVVGHSLHDGSHRQTVLDAALADRNEEVGPLDVHGGSEDFAHVLVDERGVDDEVDPVFAGHDDHGELLIEDAPVGINRTGVGHAAVIEHLEAELLGSLAQPARDVVLPEARFLVEHADAAAELGHPLHAREAEGIREHEVGLAPAPDDGEHRGGAPHPAVPAEEAVFTALRPLRIGEEDVARDDVEEPRHVDLEQADHDHLVLVEIPLVGRGILPPVEHRLAGGLHGLIRELAREALARPFGVAGGGLDVLDGGDVHARTLSSFLATDVFEGVERDFDFTTDFHRYTPRPSKSVHVIGCCFAEDPPQYHAARSNGQRILP